MRDFCDGELFEAGHHPLFSISDSAIQIILYYDDFEVANPLGSKATLHKLGGFYWLLGNIHPKYRSSLKMLNLAILCPTKWIKKYGLTKILKPMMADITLLESECGVQLEIAGRMKPVVGSLCLVLADNLGSNAIGCFMESFSARKPCRFCMGNLEDFQLKFTEEDFTMRTKDGYDRQAQLVSDDPQSATVYGVKGQSALNSSKFFHVVGGLPSDIMHDILEGVLPLHMKALLSRFVVEKKFFTLEELNKRILHFPFGSNDSSNRPSLIKNLNTADRHMNQSASQMWCLSRLLPLVIHNLIPEDNEDWKLFTDLMRIVDVLFSPVIKKGTTFYLAILIKEYLQEFKKTYPEIYLIPKQHFMVHYPAQIRRHGPLVRQWCMRFEAKHHYFKKLAHGMTNFKNLPKTLAVRHQRLQCYWLSEDDAYLKPVTDPGPGTTLEVKDVVSNKRAALCQFDPSLGPDTKIYMTKWAVVHGVKYNKGSVVVQQHLLFPEFIKIEDIFLLPNGDVMICCHKLLTLGFWEILPSYQVVELNQIVLTCYSDLLDYHPLDIYLINVNGIAKKFIRMRYDLSDTKQ